MAKTNNKPSLLAWAAPTRVAAFSINSRTIYNLLRLPVNYPFKKLPAASLTLLQQVFKDIYYFILNEKFIIGQVYLV